MMNNKWCVSCGILTFGLIPALSGTASAQDVEPRNAVLIDEELGAGGEVTSGAEASFPNGDVVYRMERLSGSFFRAFPGYRDYDDIHAQHGGELISYRVLTFGSNSLGNDAGLPYDVQTRLYDDSAGNPSIGLPTSMIPGSECNFVGVPAGSLFELVCKPAPGVIIPDAFWLAVSFSNDNAGWVPAECDAASNPDIGFSEDFWGYEDIINSPGTIHIPFFCACNCNPNFYQPCCSMVARVVVSGNPWACCEANTFDCVNVQETQCDPATSIFTEDTLCNDLDPPCSEAGSCCDIARGVCTNSFESLCRGFTDVFTAGSSCTAVTCDLPDNVPNITRWGMIVLAVVLLTGLTIKFGRRRTATAQDS